MFSRRVHRGRRVRVCDRRKAAHCSIDDSEEAYGIAEVVVKPIVTPDTYNMVGGKLVVPAATGLLANDKGVDQDLVTSAWTTGVGDIVECAGRRRTELVQRRIGHQPPYPKSRIRTRPISTTSSRRVAGRGI
jgi:hypothetical protein